jgi:GNAT superfamily N-acetyltransferase
MSVLWVELGKQASFRRSLPYINQTFFQRSVITANRIQESGDIRGFHLQTKPSDEFRAYGELESLLMIYPEHQRQGIGTQVMSLIHEDMKPTFFVSSKSNPVSTAFFQKQTSLSLSDETDRYRVYTL